MPPSERPLVSAVIPVCNGELFITDAIESVLGQSYDNIECIVVDDGSTDRTTDIVATFGSRVSLLKLPHAGLGAARNSGIRSSKGTFVAFLDSDDVWLPEKIARQVELFERQPTLAGCYTAMTLVDGKLNRVGLLPAPPSTRALRNTLLLEHPYVPSIGSSGMLRKDVLERVGSFDESLESGEDHELFCRIAIHNRLEGLGEPLVLRRCHPAQMHLDPSRTEREMGLILDRMFANGLPPDLRTQKRRATANLNISVAGLHLKRKNYLSFLRYAARAAAIRPDRVLVATARIRSLMMWRKLYADR